jgi:uncharacterized membrane protein YdjX (TVP38/TMEM64 family)
MLNLRIAIICIWAIAIIAIVLYIGPDTIINDYRNVTPHGIREFVLSYGAFSESIYVLMQAFRPFTFLPATPFTIAGGYIFGHASGLLLSTLGTTLAAVISFSISRYLFRDYIKNKLSGRYAGIGERFDKSGIFVIAAMRVVPVIPFDAVSYLAGVSSIGFMDYLIGTVLGELPGAFVLTMLGSNIKNVKSPMFLISLALAALLILGPELYRRKVKKREQKN